MKGKVKITEIKYSINHVCSLKNTKKRDMKRSAAVLTKMQLTILNYRLLDESKI